MKTQISYLKGPLDDMANCPVSFMREHDLLYYWINCLFGYVFVYYIYVQGTVSLVMTD